MLLSIQDLLAAERLANGEDDEASPLGACCPVLPLLGLGSYGVPGIVPAGISFTSLRGYDGTPESEESDSDAGTRPASPIDQASAVAGALPGAAGALIPSGGGDGLTKAAPGAAASGGGSAFFNASNLTPGGPGGFDLATAGIAVAGAGGAAAAILSQEKLDRSRSHKTLEKKRLRSVTGGAVGGAVSGAAIGSMIPVVGTVIGAIVGGAAGAAGGLFSQSQVKKKNRKLRQRETQAQYAAHAATIEQERAARQAVIVEARAVSSAKLALTQATRTGRRLAISVRQNRGEVGLAASLQADLEAIEAEGAATEDQVTLSELQVEAKATLQDLQALDDQARSARPKASTGLRGLGAAHEHDTTEGGRPSCLDCVRKHLSQAAVLLEESRQGYPEHRWRAVGHMAEASAESLAAHPELANAIRDERLRVMGDAAYDPPLMALIDRACALAEPRRRTGLRGLGSANDYVFRARKANRVALGLTPQGDGGRLAGAVVAGVACAAAGAVLAGAWKKRRRR